MWNREASPHAGGSPEPPTSAPRTAPRAIEEKRIGAWVGKSVVFKGDLISSEDMTIDGRVEGTIEVRDHGLTIGPDANIHADIVATTVTVLGAVTGSITAHEKIQIGETASVDGEILSPRLVMADGAVLRGRVEAGTRRGLPDDEQRVLTAV